MRDEWADPGELNRLIKVAFQDRGSARPAPRVHSDRIQVDLRVPGLVFGYEEAIGFCVDPRTFRDKDGISASTKLAALAASLKAEGRSVQDRLDELARAFGLHATAPADHPC